VLFVCDSGEYKRNQSLDDYDYNSVPLDDAIRPLATLAEQRGVLPSVLAVIIEECQGNLTMVEKVPPFLCWTHGPAHHVAA
jgi:hypothetical protein